jgi:hypothetical protein
MKTSDQSETLEKNKAELERLKRGVPFFLFAAPFAVLVVSDYWYEFKTTGCVQLRGPKYCGKDAAWSVYDLTGIAISVCITAAFVFFRKRYLDKKLNNKA